jgi:hypothetical protein
MGASFTKRVGGPSGKPLKAYSGIDPSGLKFTLYPYLNGKAHIESAP